MDCPRCDGLAVRHTPHYGLCLKCGKLFLIEHYYPEAEQEEDQDYESRASTTATRKDSLS